MRQPRRIGSFCGRSSPSRLLSSSLPRFPTSIPSPRLDPAPRRRDSGEMSRFGRSGPPPIRDTYSLLVLNITFREFPPRRGASVPFAWFELAAHLCLGDSQERRPMTSSRSSTSTARSLTSTSPGTAGESVSVTRTGATVVSFADLSVDLCSMCGQTGWDGMNN